LYEKAILEVDITKIPERVHQSAIGSNGSSACFRVARDPPPRTKREGVCSTMSGKHRSTFLHL
jgi:hypothetical protein